MYQTINLTRTPQDAERSRNFLVENIKEALMLDLNADPKSVKMLDVGCGAGNLIRYARSIGVDVQGIDAAHPFHNNQDLPIVQGYISDMPFADNTFNLVYANGVFDPRLYPQDLKKSFAQIARVTQSKGILAIVDMDMPSDDIIQNAGFDQIYKIGGGRKIFQKKITPIYHQRYTNRYEGQLVLYQKFFQRLFVRIDRQYFSDNDIIKTSFARFPFGNSIPHSDSIVTVKGIVYAVEVSYFHDLYRCIRHKFSHFRSKH